MVMLNKCKSSIRSGTTCHPGHLTRKRIVEKSCLIQAKTVSTTTVKEHDRDGGTGTEEIFYGESIQEDFWKQGSSGKKQRTGSTLPRAALLGRRQAWHSTCGESVFKVRSKSQETKLDEAETQWTESGRHSAGCIPLLRPLCQERGPLPTQPGHGTFRTRSHPHGAGC